MPNVVQYIKELDIWLNAGSVESLDVEGMVPTTNPPPAGATTRVVTIETQYGNLKIPRDATMLMVGDVASTSTNVAPGAPESVTATLSGDDIVVNAQAPQQVGSPPYHAIIVGLDGATDPNPLLLPTGLLGMFRIASLLRLSLQILTCAVGLKN